ncbi:alpha-tocopherol transfer protein-like [Haematobia irritans]|uniref:alpha-tocopherol transfer protein-like n=1 Tax=Haematobia irritans TaxID=7368 RepID=UPI003F4F6D55
MAQIKPLSEELQRVAINELGEVPSRIPQDLEIFKTWIEQQPHLKARMDDQFLIQFLRGSKYSIEKAKQKLDMFYAMRTKYPDMFAFTNVDDERFLRLHRSGFFAVLPTPLHENGPRIILVSIRQSAENYTLEDVLRYSAAMLELAVRNDPHACINGITCVIDYEHATVGHFMQFTPTMAKIIAAFHEKALPIRGKKFVLINLTKTIHQFVNALLPYYPEKFRNRVLVCGTNLDDLGKEFPRKYFPIEFGGTNGSMNEWHVETEKLFEEYREYFKENDQYGTDERLRIGKPMNFGDNVGINGTFRKLDVD